MRTCTTTKFGAFTGALCFASLLLLAVGVLLPQWATFRKVIILDPTVKMDQNIALPYDCTYGIGLFYYNSQYGECGNASYFSDFGKKHMPEESEADRMSYFSEFTLSSVACPDLGDQDTPEPMPGNPTPSKSPGEPTSPPTVEPNPFEQAVQGQLCSGITNIQILAVSSLILALQGTVYTLVVLVKGPWRFRSVSVLAAVICMVLSFFLGVGTLVYYSQTSAAMPPVVQFNAGIVVEVGEVGGRDVSIAQTYGFILNFMTEYIVAKISGYFSTETATFEAGSVGFTLFGNAYACFLAGTTMAGASVLCLVAVGLGGSAQSDALLANDYASMSLQ